MPVVRLISVQPSSEVQEGNSLRVTLEIDSPVSADDPGLTGGRLIGGIRGFDSREGVRLVDSVRILARRQIRSNRSRSDVRCE